MQNGACHFCQTAFLFEKTLRTKKDEIKEMITNQKEEN
jgi:hypothetical protein